MSRPKLVSCSKTLILLNVLYLFRLCPFYWSRNAVAQFFKCTSDVLNHEESIKNDKTFSILQWTWGNHVRISSGFNFARSSFNTYKLQLRSSHVRANTCTPTLRSLERHMLLCWHNLLRQNHCQKYSHGTFHEEPKLSCMYTSKSRVTLCEFSNYSPRSTCSPKNSPLYCKCFRIATPSTTRFHKRRSPFLNVLSAFPLIASSAASLNPGSPSVLLYQLRITEECGKAMSNVLLTYS